MTRIRSVCVATAVAAFGFAAAAPTHDTLAQNAALECAPFTLVGDQWQAGVSDIGEEGASIGDGRLGTYRLIDEAGHEHGVLHYAGHVVDISDDAHAVHGTASYVTSSGTIAATYAFGHENVGDLERRAGALTMIISGGSGQFRRAHGVIEADAPREDGSRVFNFDIACD